MEHIEKEIILKVQDLEIGFNRKKEFRTVVDKITFEVYEGEILGIVGESGSGKSLTALAIADLLRKEAIVKNGSIDFLGRNLLSLSEEELRRLKGQDIGIIFQEPMTSLNPLITIGRQVEEVLKIHSDYSKEERKNRTIKMLIEVGLKDGKELYHKYPHQLSGGMRQRVMIAMAMICSPKLLIADEPTTALDVTIQAQILELIQNLCKEKKTTVIFISHDLGVIKRICDRTMVMHHGKIVESGDVNTLFENPTKEYTKQLLQAVPSMKKGIKNHCSIIKSEKKQILEVKDLYVYYQKDNRYNIRRKIEKKEEDKAIVKGVSFTINEGEILGILGESGCGKTTLSKAIVGLNKDVRGQIISDIKTPQMVFQDPYQSLNPAKNVGWLLEEPLRLKGEYTKEERKKIVNEMLLKVGLSEEYKERSVKELSGGQRQRVSIACAIITNTKLIILDEPVSALDVTVQAQILNLLKSLRKELGLSYLFISHDLNVIYEMCDRVLVMYQGEIVEEADINELYHNPKHEFTKKLLKVIPDL